MKISVLTLALCLHALCAEGAPVVERKQSYIQRLVNSFLSNDQNGNVTTDFSGSLANSYIQTEHSNSFNSDNGAMLSFSTGSFSSVSPSEIYIGNPSSSETKHLFSFSSAKVFASSAGSAASEIKSETDIPATSPTVDAETLMPSQTKLYTDKPVMSPMPDAITPGYSSSVATGDMKSSLDSSSFASPNFVGRNSSLTNPFPLNNDSAHAEASTQSDTRVLMSTSRSSSLRSLIHTSSGSEEQNSSSVAIAESSTYTSSTPASNIAKAATFTSYSSNVERSASEFTSKSSDVRMTIVNETKPPNTYELAPGSTTYVISNPRSTSGFTPDSTSTPLRSDLNFSLMTSSSASTDVNRSALLEVSTLLSAPSSSQSSRFFGSSSNLLPPFRRLSEVITSGKSLSLEAHIVASLNATSSNTKQDTTLTSESLISSLSYISSESSLSSTILTSYFSSDSSQNFGTLFPGRTRVSDSIESRETDHSSTSDPLRTTLHYSYQPSRTNVTTSGLAETDSMDKSSHVHYSQTTSKPSISPSKSRSRTTKNEDGIYHFTIPYSHTGNSLQSSSDVSDSSSKLNSNDKPGGIFTQGGSIDIPSSTSQSPENSNNIPNQPSQTVGDVSSPPSRTVGDISSHHSQTVVDISIHPSQTLAYVPSDRSSQPPVSTSGLPNASDTSQSVTLSKPFLSAPISLHENDGTINVTSSSIQLSASVPVSVSTWYSSPSEELGSVNGPSFIIGTSISDPSKASGSLNLVISVGDSGTITSSASTTPLPISATIYVQIQSEVAKLSGAGNSADVSNPYIDSGPTETFTAQESAVRITAINSSGTIAPTDASVGTDAPISTKSTSNWVPTQIIADTSTSALLTKQTDSPAPQKSGLPRAITPASTTLPGDEYAVVTIGFLEELNYPFVVQHSLSSAQIFEYLPQVLTYNFTSQSLFSNVTVKRLVPYTAEGIDYVITVAEVYFPVDNISSLQSLLLSVDSKLYKNPDETKRKLSSLIDNRIPLTGITNSVSSGTTSLTDNGSVDSGSNISSKPKSHVVGGIVAGASIGTFAYMSLMMLLFRRFRKKKSLELPPSDSESSFDDAFQTPSSVGSSGTRPPISHPVHASNSLGWSR